MPQLQMKVRCSTNLVLSVLALVSTTGEDLDASILVCLWHSDTCLPVSALVLDVGTHTTRAGYAGEDTPKVIVPTSHGYLDADAAEGRVRKYFVGEEGVSVWRDGMEVGSCMADGIGKWNRRVPLLLLLSPSRRPSTDTLPLLLHTVADPTPLSSILSHVLHSRLHVNPHEHPLLTTEPAWNTAQNREYMAELAFEQEGVPAWYTACNGVLSAFAAGKGTALVVDVGESGMSVTPVCEGYVLRAGQSRRVAPRLPVTLKLTD